VSYASDNTCCLKGIKEGACGFREQGNSEDTGTAALNTADGLKQLVASARGIAATVPAGSTISPSDVLSAADDILDKSANLIAAAKTAVDDPENPNGKAQLTQVWKNSVGKLCSFIRHTLTVSALGHALGKVGLSMDQW